MNKNQLLTTLNEASRDELLHLSGIGPAMAEKIISARPFNTLEDSYVIAGINDKFVSRLVTGDSTEVEPFVNLAGGEEINQPTEMIFNHDAQEEDQEVILLRSGRVPVEQRLEAPAEDELASEMSLDSDGMDDRDPVFTGTIPGSSENSESDSRLNEVIAAENGSQNEVHVGIQSGEPSEMRSEGTTPDQGSSKEFAQKKDVDIQSNRKIPFWGFVVTAMITILLSVLVTLGILNAINRSLTYATSAQLTASKSEALLLSERVDSIKQDLDSIRDRVDILSGLNDRTASLEKNQKTLSSDLELLDQELADIQDKLTVMNDQIELQASRTSRFDTFLQDLKTLLADLYQAEGVSK